MDVENSDDDFAITDDMPAGEAVSDDISAPTPEVLNQTPADLTAPPPDLPPTREEIDQARATWQFTPSEVNGAIDRRRPFFRTAGFSDHEIDDYYGVDNFDWKAAASNLLTAAKDAADYIIDPKGLIDDIRQNFFDPQADDFDEDWKPAAAKVTRALSNSALNAAAVAGAGLVLAPEAPAVASFLAGGVALSVARAVARQKLIECQRAGSCGDPRDFRNVMLQTLADTSDPLPASVDSWIYSAVQDVMTDSWTREWLGDHPAMKVLSRMPRKTTGVFLWSLFDKDMPSDKDSYNAATVAWGHANGLLGKDAADRAPDSPPLDHSTIGHAVRNIQDAYAESGVLPHEVIGQGLEKHELFKTLLQPRPQDTRLHASATRKNALDANPVMKNIIEAGISIGVGALFDGDGGPDDEVESGSWRSPDDESSPIDDEAYDANDPAFNSEGDFDDEPQDSDAEDGEYDYHHPHPKYLGGKEDQDRLKIPRKLHQNYHKLLDDPAPRWRSKKFFDKLDEDTRSALFQEVREMTKKFDAENGSELYKWMLKNGFPEK